jgi:RDD family
MRFDEVELEPATFDLPEPPPPSARPPFLRRVAALLIDLSLFAALGLALSPLLPASVSWLTIAGLGGFVVLVSYYYFVGSWMLWGKTIGGAIFDVRAPRAMSLRTASLRWLVLCGVLLVAGAGVLVYVKA